MNKTKIEWCDLSINPVKGLCPVGCSYCYARRMYKRFHWDETIRFDDSVLYGLPKEPKRIFVGSTMELFGEWVKPDWRNHIIQTISLYPQHTFIFLTKKPKELIKRKFPTNCWVGVSVTNQTMYLEALEGLAWVDAKLKFLSFEPLLNHCYVGASDLKRAGIKWTIIGQQTPAKLKTFPDMIWVKNIVEESFKAHCEVFIKNNMKELIFTEGIKKYGAYHWGLNLFANLRQEFPL